MNKKLYALLLILLMFVFASPVMAISNGEPDEDGHPNVGAFAIKRDGVYVLRCTGTLISPTVFLTAGHCTAFLRASGSNEVYVTFDSQLTQAGNFIVSSEFYTHPNFGHDWGNHYDLGVIILPEGSTEGITPATLAEEGLLDTLAAKGGLHGQDIINVGYGGVPDWKQAPPSISFDGIRRVSTSLFMGLTKSWLKLLMNNDATDEGGTCYGDSGGPHFLQTNDGEILIATTSGGDHVCRAVNDNYRLDIPEARQFLSEFLILP